MKSSWLYATLLPFFLFSCALPEKRCQWNDNIPEIQRVAVHSNVSVPCPRFTAGEMKFMLHKGQNKVAFITYKNISHVINSDHLGSTVNHNVNTSTNSTCFVLSNVSMDATALYTCTAEKSYPPPLENIREEPQTIVIVEEHVCVQNSQKADSSASHLALWVGLGLLSAYSLLITCISLLLRCRLKKENMSTHDYMNMKPRTQRRKQGIHHPVHLSWYKDTPNGMTASKKLPTKRTPV